MADIGLKIVSVSIVFCCCIFGRVAGNSERRIKTQLNWLSGDVADLFKSIESINKTLWSEILENKITRSKGEICNINRKTNEGGQIARLLVAFESEKRLIRNLQDDIQELQDRVETPEKESSDIRKKYEKGNKEIQDLRSRQQLLEKRFVEMNTEIESEKISKLKLKARIEALEKIIIDRFKTTLEPVLEKVTEEIKPTKDDIEETTTDVTTVLNELDREKLTAVYHMLTCTHAEISGINNNFFSSLRSTKPVFCDATTDDGGWIVTMRRKDGSENFKRSWEDYKYGFGEVDGEFWIGNDILHELTKYDAMELRIDMEDFEGGKAYAHYDLFRIGSESEKYKLFVSGYSGTAGDSLNHPNTNHNGMKFTTFDSDNDNNSYNCAVNFPGGWWFNMCFRSHLTGVYSNTSDIERWHGVIWYTKTGAVRSLKFVEMKLRYR